MIKNLLVKLANKIINKYKIHYLNIDSTIYMYNKYYKIIEIDNYKSNSYNEIRIRGTDISNFIEYYNKT